MRPSADDFAPTTRPSAAAFAPTAPGGPSTLVAPLTLRAVLDALAAFAMFAALGLVAALILAGCSSKRIEAAPERSAPSERAMSSSEPTAAPSAKLAPVAADRLCVTKGAASIGATVTEPTMRGVALGAPGDAASLSFVFRGDTATTRELASGDSRRQLGLKLRAQDGCNLVYVMWRLDPKPSLSVSLKQNPGKRTHKECGATGYTRLKPARGAALAPLPALSAGASHTLRAEIAGDELLAWIDGQLAWRGPLPPGARDLSGPAGLRSDNVSFDLVAFSAGPAPSGSSAAKTGPAPAKCTPEASD